MKTLAYGQALLCTAYLALSLGHDSFSKDEPPEYSHLPNEAKYVTLDDDMRDDLDRVSVHGMLFECNAMKKMLRVNFSIVTPIHFINT